jgi:methylmalonyl-CoA mutase
LFQDFEKAGGAAAALESGLIQQKVAAVRTEREKAIATRRDPLTGTSDYPNLGEAAASVLDVAPVILPPLDKAVSFEALSPMRLAEPFEDLRDRSDAVLAATGKRPSLFLANLGSPSDFTARATFAKSFFEAGGIAAAANDGFRSTDALVAAFKASGATLACLCGSDEINGKDAVAAAKALKTAGARLYLAGRPGDAEAQYRQAGIEGFVFAGCDALANLRTAHDMIGTESQDRE